MPQQGQRAASTAATRLAVIDAARELLAAGDWRRFTLDAVATAAGVTRMTVYNQVRSKAGLLDAVLTDLTERGGMDRLLTATQQLSAADAYVSVVERTCRFWHAERAVLRPLFGLSAVDQDIAANLAQREEWRGAQLGRLLDRLVEEGAAEIALPRPAALAGIVAVTSFPAYNALGALADDPLGASEVVRRLVSGLIGGFHRG